jgi:hypothetical protein
MPLFNFGSGTIVGRRNGVDQNNAVIANPTPAQFAVLQDIDISFDRTLKELIGQNSYPADIAGAQTKISGKAKLAGMQANFFNDMFFGQVLTSGASVGEQMAVNEVHVSATTITIAPPGTGTFVHDLGVLFVATGVQLVRVASAPATGQYSVVESTGVYTMAVADAGLSLAITYSYTVGAAGTMKMITVTNQLMGITPSFELHAQMNYPNSTSGVVQTLNLKLFACKASKLDFPFKNTDHTLPSMDFQAFADVAGNVLTLTLPQ